MPSENDGERDVYALRDMIEEIHLILETTELPQGRSKRALELLTSALALTDDLIATSPAAALGKRGGLKTAQRGAGYFREIAAKRKTRAGGRPRKSNG